VAFGMYVCLAALELRDKFNVGLDRRYICPPLHEPEIEIYKILQEQLITEFLHNMNGMSNTIYNYY
jgi:hypothetical protein